MSIIEPVITDMTLSNVLTNVMGSSNPTPSKHVFLIAGQSNATSRAPFDGGADWPSNVLQLSRNAANATTPFETNNPDRTIVPAVRPLDHWKQPEPSGMGWALSFALEYINANPSVDELIFVPSAFGGTSFQGQRWRVGDDLYNDAVARTNFTMGLDPDYRFMGILWHQGESDTSSTTVANAHAGLLDAMIDGMRSDITAANATTPFVLGGMLPSWVSANNDRGIVQAGLEDTPNRNFYTGYAPSTGLVDFDGIHFDAASMRIFGQRYLNAYNEARLNTPTAPNQVIGIDANGSDGQVTLSWGAPNDNGSPITDYIIEVDDGSGFSVINDGVSTSTYFIHTGLSNGTDYTYRVSAVNGIGTGVASATVTGTPSDMPLVSESDATGHWFFGADNPTYADLISARTLTENGTSPILGSGFMTISGVSNGLLSDIPDSANVTLCLVVRRVSSADVILGGNLLGGQNGWSPFFTETGDKLGVNNFEGSNYTIVQENFPTSPFIFIAVSLDSNGNYVYYRGDDPAITATGNAGRGTVTNRNISLGDVHFNNSDFSGQFEVAEMILYQGIAKTKTQLDAILQRSVARLKPRGITVAGEVFIGAPGDGTPITNGMVEDASWTSSATQYTDLVSATDASCKVVATFGSTDSGVIMESGASAYGLILYLHNGTLYFKCGDGSSDTGSLVGAAECSWPITGGSQQYLIEWSASSTTGKASLYIEGGAVSVKNFTADLLCGGNEGTVGAIAKQAALNRGNWLTEGQGAFTGTITECKIYLGEITPDVT